jgi:plastocyanin
MHRLRSLRLVALGGFLGLALLGLAGCSSGEPPAWTYAPAPSATPVPSAAASASPGASAAPSTAASAAPSSGGGPAIELSAQNIQFDKSTILAPAGQPFKIHFVNNDSGQIHNVEIKDANGQSLFRGAYTTGITEITYDVPALPAGDYSFNCTVHPNMVGTLSAG